MQWSIVIPTFNRRQILEQTFASVAAIETPARAEIIVVDDGSTDGTAEYVRTLPCPLAVTVTRQDNGGAAAARNAGARLAKGAFLLFLDDDMVVDPAILTAHHRALLAGADAAVGRISVHPTSPPSTLVDGLRRWSEERDRRLLASDGNLQLADLLAGQLSVRADVFASLKGFDETLTAGGSFGGEDTDFLYRLIRSGSQVRFAPDARSAQIYATSIDQYLLQAHQAGRANAALSRKHLDLASGLHAQHQRSRQRRSVVWAARHAPDRLRAAVGSRLLRQARSDSRNVMARWSMLALRDVAYKTGVRDGGGMTGSGTRILAFHAVNNLADAASTDPVRSLAVSPDGLRGHLTALCDAGFRFVDVEEFFTHLRSGDRDGGRRLLLTFDDGYDDLSHAVGPLLAELGIRAAAFVVTGLIGATNEWDDKAGWTRLPLADAAALRVLANQGWEIGAHSTKHAHLRALGVRALDADLKACASDLVNAGLPAPRILGYPYGESSRKVRRAARRAGYDAAFGLSGRRARPSRERAFDVPRIEVTAATTSQELLGKIFRSLDLDT